MEILRNTLLVLHFIGLGALLGGFLTQMSALRTGTARINPAILHGALTQLITGLALVGIAEMSEEGEVNNTKVAVKLIVLIVIYALALIHRKKESVSSAVIGSIGALTIANIVVAVFW